MSLSHRSSWDLQINPLTAALTRRRKQGARVIDLTLSNPTQAGLFYPEAIQQVMGRPELARYQPEPLGLGAARQAVQGYYQEKGIDLKIDQLLLTASTSEAYGWLFKLLADPGDEVLTPQPSYPLFEFLAGLEGITMRPYPLRYGDTGWEIDLDQLAAAIGAQSRAVLLVNPNNPTGSFVKRGERQEIEALARECGLALIVDEVFADYPLTGDAERVTSFAGQAGVLTFVLSGLSKVLGLPQLKVSWIAVDGPQELRQQALARLEIIADTYLSVGTPVQQALAELMGLRQPFQEPLRQRLRQHGELLQRRIAGKTLRSEGGWYAVLEIDRPEEALVLELLEEEGVLVHPGYFFDFPSDGFVVLSLLSPEFEEGLERMSKHL